MIARASVEAKDEEKEVIRTMQFIKDIVANETYAHLLHTENSEGLRPLELAAHLGTFGIFNFYSKRQMSTWLKSTMIYTVFQYFDITEYIIGDRVGKSPLKAMLYLEETKLALNSTQIVFQEDPMRCWFRAMLYANTPFLILWFLARLFLVVSMVFTDIYYVIEEIYSLSSMNGSAACLERTESEMYMYVALYIPSSALVVVLISVVDNMISVVCYMCCRPRWLHRTVYAKKVACVRYRFYVLIHSVCVIIYAIHQFIDIAPVFMVAFGFVWSFLFFLQILPMFGNYVVATQRMISIFIEFLLVFSIFYIWYCFTLYKLLFPFYGADFADIRLAAYNTFLIMQNMFAFKVQPEIASDYRLHLLHITFVLMVPILLLNILIALLISAYTYVNENRWRYRDCLLLWLLKKGLRSV